MESPESRIIPSEDMNTVQLKYKRRKVSGVILELFDNCNWSLQCFNKKGIMDACPNCGKAVYLIPMNIDEVCSLSYDEKIGMTVIFDRERPVR